VSSINEILELQLGRSGRLQRSVARALGMPPKRGAPGSQPERGAKRRAVAALDGGMVAQDMAKQQADRAFWEQYSTPLIWAWATDYDGAPQFTLEQRDAILSFLVTSEGVIRPLPASAKRKLFATWKNRSDWEKGSALPPLFHVEVADAGSDGDDAPTSPPPVAPRSAVALLPLPTRVQSPPAAASSAALSSSAGALIKKISSTAAQSSAPVEQQRQCSPARVSRPHSHICSSAADAVAAAICGSTTRSTRRWFPRLRLQGHRPILQRGLVSRSVPIQHTQAVCA